MCYLKKRIKNPKYLPNKKNNFQPPVCTDERKRYIEIECGECPECRKKKRREWGIRIIEEIRSSRSAVFFTGTISPERMDHLIRTYNTTDKNEIITKECRLFFERIRKRTKKSVKHWAVTEVGEEKGRIHVHMMCFSQTLSKWNLTNLLWDAWKAGYKYYGKYCNGRTANYITKYMLKENETDKDFRPKILASKGIGAAYCDKESSKQRHAYVKKTVDTRTIETYLTDKWTEIALPRYYRNKIWDDDVKDQLFTEKLDDEIVWIGKESYSIRTREECEQIEKIEKEYKENMIMLWGFSEKNLMEIRKKRSIKRKSKYNYLIQTGKIKEKVEEYEKRNRIHSGRGNMQNEERSREIYQRRTYNGVTHP